MMPRNLIARRTALCAVLTLCVALGLATSQAMADTRTTFAYTGGTFERIAPGSWQEIRDNGPTSHFSEVARTNAYIELYDRDRDMKVRLYSHVGKWYHRESKRWVGWPGSEGCWR